MAALLCDVYQSFDEPLTHEMLYGWHSMLFKGPFLSDWGKYRTHLEPMQIVSNRYDSLQVFFEAPPSERVAYEMEVFVRMFEEGPQGFKGGLSAENYMAITKASRATATRDLTDLVEKGIFVKTGELRHTRYWLGGCDER